MSLLLLLAACEGEGPESPATTPLAASWVTAVVADPTRFSAVVDPAREGWVALHRNDWLAASAAGGAAGTRAAVELTTLHRVLAGLSDDAWLALGEGWEKRGTLPKDSLFPRIVTIAALDANRTEAAARWGAMPAPPEPAELADLALRHEALRRGEGDVDAFRRAAASPIATEAAETLAVASNGAPPSPSALVRTFYDPRVHRTLAATYEARAKAGPAPTDLGAQLFSADLGVDPGVVFPVAGDDAEACRDAVRQLDAKLDAWATQLGTTANDDGRALLDDLRLVAGTRSRLLVSKGVDALQASQPRCALAYAEMARDHEDPRAVGPLNSPTLFAVLATANLRTGHTREALDALEVLTAPFPETTALDETVGDLAVLQGIDRAGDSREN